MLTHFSSRHYQISRIRSFYMRKVKFTESNLNEKLAGILGEFPKIEVFYTDSVFNYLIKCHTVKCFDSECNDTCVEL